MRKRFALGIAGNEPVDRGMIDIRREVAGLDLGGAAQADARAVRLALALKRDAEVVMRFGEIGPKRDGLLASGHGLTDELDGRLHPADPRHDHAEEMSRRVVVRPSFKPALPR